MYKHCNRREFSEASTAGGLLLAAASWTQAVASDPPPARPMTPKMARDASRDLLLVLAVLVGTWYGGSDRAPAIAGETVGDASEATAIERAIGSITGMELFELAATISDDRFEGRKAGTKKGAEAGEYLADQMKELGLAPAGDDGSYFQSFHCRAGDCRNILGLLEGSDPDLKEEAILVCAHYDHIGVGRSGVNNGADDNASGVAGTLELAEAFAELEERPRRSLLFALWDAEEAGLYGSKHFARNPTFPIDRITFALNFDMIGRLRDDTVTVYGARSGAGVRKLFSEQNAESHLTLDFRGMMSTRSDHYSLFQKGVPSVLAFTGVHSDLHRPTDDAELLNREGMQRVARWSFRVLHELTQREDRLVFCELPKSEISPSMTGRSQLPLFTPKDFLCQGGFAYVRERSEPGSLLITAIAADSPAQRAGVEPYDRVHKIGDHQITPNVNPDDLLTETTPRTLVVEHDGRLRTLTIQPTPDSAQSIVASLGSGLWAMELGETQEATPSTPPRVEDSFEGKLARDWQIRGADLSHLSLAKRSGAMTIVTQAGGIRGQANNSKNLLIRPNPFENQGDFEMTACLTGFDPIQACQQAGLICYNTPDHYLKFVVQCGDDSTPRQLAVLLESNGNTSAAACAKTAPDGDRVWLRLTKRGSTYAYATSSDGESYQVHGEVDWSSRPEKIGLVAENGDGSQAAEIDATFDSFALVSRPPNAAPVYFYGVPTGDAAQLASFIRKLQQFKPATEEQKAEYEERAPTALNRAASELLHGHRDKSSDEYHLAQSVLLPDRVRRMAQLPSYPEPWAQRISAEQREKEKQKRQQEVMAEVYMHLEAQAAVGLGPRDLKLAILAVETLGDDGQYELAAKTCSRLHELMIDGKGVTDDAMPLLEQLEGAARRYALPGKLLDLNAVRQDNTFRWADYRDKVTLVAFWSVDSEASLRELAFAKVAYDRYRERAFDVLVACTDEKHEELKKLLEEDGLPWSVVPCGEAGASNSLIGTLGVKKPPLSILVDKHGIVLSVRAGDSTLESLLQQEIGPPYQPVGELVFLDLASKANQKLTVKLHNNEGNDLRELPRGRQIFGGVTFDVKDAVIQLSGKNLPDRPKIVEGIPIGRAFRRLFLLQATGWEAEDNARIGEYRVHYEDGTLQVVPILYGQDVRNWQTKNDDRPVLKGSVAWVGQNAYTRRTQGSTRLFLGDWNNPNPTKKVTTIDVVSATGTAAPFCVAMTVECTAEDPEQESCPMENP
ncbi:MAG: M28 family peptidase [Pirellulales bacterium]|nr:M28 family peptidase [Pirellulales bacterium]